MCVMEAAVAFVTAAGASLVGLYGQNQRIKQQNYVIRQNYANAISAENQAKIERQEGIDESRREKLKSILATGNLNTKIAAGNIGLNSMTPFNLAETEKLNGENNSLAALKIGNRRAENYMDKAYGYYQNAELTSIKSKSDLNSFLVDSGMRIGTQTLNAWAETESFRKIFGK